MKTAGRKWGKILNQQRSVNTKISKYRLWAGTGKGVPMWTSGLN